MQWGCVRLSDGLREKLREWLRRTGRIRLAGCIGRISRTGSTLAPLSLEMESEGVGVFPRREFLAERGEGVD